MLKSFIREFSLYAVENLNGFINNIHRKCGHMRKNVRDDHGAGPKQEHGEK